MQLSFVRRSCKILIKCSTIRFSLFFFFVVFIDLTSKIMFTTLAIYILEN